MDSLRRAFGLKKEPPPPFPLTRRTTSEDPGGSRPPRRRPSIHNRLHHAELPRRARSPRSPPPLPVADLLEADDATIRAYAMAPPRPWPVRRAETSPL